MASTQLERLKAAYETANDGGTDALVSLFTPETVWSGPERGILWWRRAPS